MARYKITGPDGHTYVVTAPDDATEQEVLQYAQSQMVPPIPQPGVDPMGRGNRLPVENPTRAAVRGLGMAAAQGASFGTADEGAAAITAAMGGDYDKALEDYRTELELTRQERPWASLGAEVAGAIPTGVALGRAGMAVAPQAASKIPAFARWAGLGGAGGAAYGFAAGEGGVSNRAEDAAIGGAMGAAGGVLVPAAGRIAGAAIRTIARSPARKATEKAARRVARAIYDDDMTPGRIMSRLARGRGDETIADVAGENTRRLAQSGFSKPSPSRNAAAQNLRQRNQTQYRRFTDEIASLVSGDDAVKTADDLVAYRARLANEAYEKALSKTDRLYGNDIADLIESPVIKREINALRKFPEYQDLPDNSFVLLDRVYKEIGGKAEAVRRTGNKVNARTWNDLQARLKGAIIKEVPEYKDALKVFFDESKNLDALTAGRSILKTSSDDVAMMLDDMTPAERDMFTIGAAQALRDQVAGANFSSDLVKRLFRSPEFKMRVRLAFPSERAFRKFESFMLREAGKVSTNRTVLGGSPTQARLAEEAAMLADDEMKGVLMDALMGRPGAAAAKVGGGVVRKMIERSRQPGERVAGNVVDMLLSPDPVQNQATLTRLLMLDKAKADKAVLGNALAFGGGIGSSVLSSRLMGR